MGHLDVEPALGAVAACVAAAHDPDEWAEVARLAARALGADRATIGFMGGARGLLFRACPETDPDWHARYDAEMHAANTVWAEAARMESGEVHTPRDTAARRRYLASTIHNEFIRPQGFDALLTMALTNPRGGSVGLLTVGRRRGRDAFDRDDVEAARLLAGALARCLRAAGPVLRGPVEADTDSAPRELLVTPDGRLLRQEAWLGPWIRGGVFTLTGGVISSPRLPALAAAIRATGRAPDGWPPPVGITVGPVETPMGTIRLALLPGGRSGRGAVRIRIEAVPRDGAETRLARRFGLTTRESQIAVALAAGLTLPEAAEAQGIGLTTARTHLSRLFDKTDTRSQVRLALLLQRTLRDGS
jgi:DNA-binding CsgD family transcriptional regulator